MDEQILAISAVMRFMVSDPSSVMVEVVRKDGCIMVLVKANKIGQLIGRQGRNALSLRILLNAMMKNLGERAVLDFMEATSPPDLAA